MKRGAEGSNIIRDFILGGQDGLVNVLGIVLGVVTATQDYRIVIVAGLSALVAESLSMGAVAYTSAKAAREYYLGEKKAVLHSLETTPEKEALLVKQAYKQKGFSGKTLNEIVNRITNNKELWVNTVMIENTGLTAEQFENPLRSGVLVLLATLVGSIIPLIVYLFVPIVRVSMYKATILTLSISALALFVGGILKAKYTIGKPLRSGIELLGIGMIAAIAGFIIGEVLQRVLF